MFPSNEKSFTLLLMSFIVGGVLKSFTPLDGTSGQVSKASRLNSLQLRASNPLRLATKTLTCNTTNPRYGRYTIQ